MKNLIKVGITAVLALMVVYSCSNDDDFNEQKAQIKVSLTDAPGNYDHVYIDVQDVKINGNNDEASIGDINAGIYDLLELTGGVSVLLADNEVPAGQLSQLRLVLGENNSIVVNGVTHALATPSAEQSGLKLNINKTLEPGVLYEFILDFDVNSSIVLQGNGTYLLKPVIHASLVAESGAIAGEVVPGNVQTLVKASNADTTISAYTNAEGKFHLHGVPDGTYTVTIEPDITSGFQVEVITNVIVTNGVVKDMGILNLT